MDPAGGQATDLHLTRRFGRVVLRLARHRRVRRGAALGACFFLITWLIASPLLGRFGRPSACGVVEPDGLVTRVVDGDTVELASGRRVRYIGIDAPELRVKVGDRWRWAPQPMAEAAWAKNRALVEGRRVRLEYDRELCDRYHRQLAYLFVDGRFVNRELVEAGLAVVKMYPPNDKHQQELLAAQASARERRVGVWSLGAAPDGAHT